MARQARHYSSREALTIKVDYVESKLDESVNSLKDVLKDIKETIAKSEIDFKEEMQQMDLRRKEEITELKTELKEVVRDNKAAMEKLIDRAESSRRWSIGIVVSIAITVIGFMFTAIIFLLNNGFQVQT